MVKKSPVKKSVVAPPTRVYRIIAVTFLLAAIGLFGAVMYVAFARATIVIKPKKEVLTTEFVTTMKREPAVGEVRGLVFEQTVEEKKRFSVTGEGSEETPTQARGEVTIINTTSNDQPLVKTTRLLTADNKLFRIDETVLVPGRSKINVAMHADLPGKEGEIPPTRFTIPGLRENVRDKIYAESATPTCCGTRTIRRLTDEDFQKAEEEFTKELIAAVSSDMRLQAVAEKLDGELFTTEVRRKEFSAKAGEEHDSFVLTLAIKATGLFYDDEALAAVSRANLRNLAGDERELVELDPARIEITAENIDANRGTAQLHIKAPAILVLRTESALFDLARLAGLPREAVRAYFERFQSIESVDIKFNPPWQTRLPRLRDRIKIRIAD